MSERPDRSLPIGIAGLIAWAAVFWTGPLVNDPAWQLWIGQQLNRGATLYGDILEVNPPLWFWVGAGIERIAGATPLSGLHWLAIGFVAYGCLSLGLIARVLDDRRERMAAAGALVLTLFATSPYAHLQREQFLLMAVLPYAALLSRRVKGAAVPGGLAFAVGLVAAPGLALKHHFLLLPLFLEGWFWWRQRRFGIRPEHVALVLAALAYAAAVILVTPDYLSVMLPLLRASYHGYNPPMFVLLLQPGLIVSLCLLAAAWLGRARLSPFGRAAAVGSAAFVLVFILQGKNFHYQIIPAVGLAVAVGLDLLLAGRGGVRSGDGRLVAIAGIALLALMPLKAGGARFDQTFNAATAELHAGEGVSMVSASQALSWPAVYERGLGWPSRTMGLWMVLTPWQAEVKGASNPRMAALGTAVRRELAAEIACRRPRIVLVDTRYDEDAPGGDQLRWFMAEPRFAAAMASYREDRPARYLRRFIRVAERGGCVPQDLRAITQPLPE